MSVTLVYITKRYDKWDKIPKDLRNRVIEQVEGKIEYYKDNYIYEEVNVPKASRDLKKIWKILMDDGSITEDVFGYYCEREDVYLCHLYDGIFGLMIKLGLKVDSFDLRSDRCSCIINLSSEKYLYKLRTFMLEKLFK